MTRERNPGSNRQSSPERAREILELTAGGTIAPADVGIAPADYDAYLAHLAVDAELAAEAAALAATSRSLALALAGPAGLTSDREIAQRIERALAPPPRIAWRRYAAAAAVLLAIGVFSWQFGPRTADEVTTAEAPYPLEPPAVPDYRGPQFVDVTAQAGIVSVNHTGEGGEKNWMVEVVGHGAAAFDMDADGDLDLFVPDGNRIDPGRQVSGTWRLFRNDGAMRFRDVTAGSGLENVAAWAGGAVAGDVDADGRTDLFIPCYGNNHLFRNLGDGRFEDVTAAAGVAGDEVEWSTAAALGDIDGDGDLDLYVANYADMRRFMLESARGRDCTWRSMSVPCGPEPMTPQQDRLYVNRGDGTFADATQVRLPRVARYSFQPAVLDFDNDGWLDVFVAADGHPNVLLLNDGTGHFTDHALAAGVAADGAGHDQACMGVAAGDFDGDGRPDLFVTNFSHEPNVLYHSRAGESGRPTFSDATRAAGLEQPSFFTLGWGAALLDADCDGDLDAACANGHLYPGVEEVVPSTAYAQHVSLFENAGDGRFREVTAGAGDGLTARRVHRGLVSADFDNDGRLDLFLTVLNGPAVMLRNDGRGAGHSIQLILRRADGRTEGAGARVEAVLADGSTHARTLLLGSSFGSSEDPRVHIGLGAEEGADIRVRWPARVGADAVVESFGALAADGSYELVEGSGTARRLR